MSCDEWPVDGEHDRRGAVARGAVDGHAAEPAQALDHLRQQAVLVGAQLLAVERADEVGGGADADERLEGQRAELPALGHGVGRGAQLVGRQVGQQLGPRPQDPDVRARTTCRPSTPARRSPAAATSIGRCGVACTASTKTRAPTAWAAATMPARSGIVPTAFEAAVTATQRVRVGEDRLDGGGGQLERAGIGLGEAHLGTGAGRGDEPRGDVGVVVEARADDLVAGLERPARRRGEAHGQRRHRRSEDDALGAGAQQPRDGGARLAPPARRCARRRWKAPPLLAEWPERIQAAISSMASSTIWVPAAPSRRAQPSVRPGKRVRCMASGP